MRIQEITSLIFSHFEEQKDYNLKKSFVLDMKDTLRQLEMELSLVDKTK